MLCVQGRKKNNVLNSPHHKSCFFITSFCYPHCTYKNTLFITIMLVVCVDTNIIFRVMWKHAHTKKRCTIPETQANKRKWINIFTSTLYDIFIVPFSLTMVYCPFHQCDVFSVIVTLLERSSQSDYKNLPFYVYFYYFLYIEWMDISFIIEWHHPNNLTFSLEMLYEHYGTA